MNHKPFIIGLTLSHLLLGGGVGESSNPGLPVTELPAAVINDCAALAVRSHNTGCGEGAYQIRWFTRTPRGHLFLVERARCQPNECHSWFVEKNTAGARLVLTMNGAYKLESVTGSYPVVEIRKDLTDSYTSYNRYTWNGERYTREHTRLVHNIDGVECATEEECRAKADEALTHNRADRTVRIWQQVHGVDWI